MPLLIIKSPNKNPRMITLKNRNDILDYQLPRNYPPSLICNLDIEPFLNSKT